MLFNHRPEWGLGVLSSEDSEKYARGYYNAVLMQMKEIPSERSLACLNCGFDCPLQLEVETNRFMCACPRCKDAFDVVLNSSRLFWWIT